MGSHEASPSESSGWVKRIGGIALLTVRDFMDDSGPQWAAAIAYYSLLSVFPLLIAAASVASYFVDPQWAIDQATSMLRQYLPAGQGQLESTIRGAIEARQGASIVSLVTLLWTGTRVFSSITRALNIAFDAAEQYGFFKRLLVELLMALTLGVLFALALISPFIFDLAATLLGQLPFQGVLFQIAGIVLPALLLFLATLLLYRFVPRRDVSWDAALPGAIVATVLIMVAQPLFFTYLQQRLGQYNAIYGTLAIAVILVFWAWIVALLLLLAGELVSHIQLILIEGRDPKEVRRQRRERKPG